MEAQSKAGRLMFLEYLKKRMQKQQTAPEIDDTLKKENLLKHRCVIVENLGKSLEALKFPYAIIGGHAVTFHGRPRMTDDIDILVAADDTNQAVMQLNLQQLSPLKTGGYSGVTPEGLRIDVVAPNQPWVTGAISQAMQTAYGQMISAPFLVITKLWDSRGSQDETDVLGVLKRMSENELSLTRQLVKQYLPNDVEDLESLISIRNY